MFQVIGYVRVDESHLECNIQAPGGNRDGTHNPQKNPMHNLHDRIRLARICQAIQEAMNDVVEDKEYQAVGEHAEEVLEHQHNDIVVSHGGLCEEEDIVDHA